jgi:hypothetical protein
LKVVEDFVTLHISVEDGWCRLWVHFGHCLRIKVVVYEFLLIKGKTTVFKPNAHANEFAHNIKIFDFKGLQTSDKIIHHASVCGGERQVMKINSNNRDVCSFMLVLEAEISLAPRISNGE